MIIFSVFQLVPGRPAPPLYVNENSTIINVRFALPDTGYIGDLPESFTIFYFPKGKKQKSFCV